MDILQYCGWLSHRADEARKSLEKNPNHFKQLNIYGAGPTPNRVMLWELARKVLGKDIDNYAQKIGDCTSFAGKNTGEYMQLAPIANGELDDYTDLFPPYFYGCSRVLIGGERHSNSDGSTAGWTTQASVKYGVLAKNAPNVPDYSGEVAKSWGYYGPDQSFITLGQQHLVKSTAAVNTQDELISALANLNPVTCASNMGFDMKARSDGIFYNSTTWSHNMSLIGYCLAIPEKNIPAHACLLNNWGDVHGTIEDWVTGDTWPIGTLRILLSDAVKILQAQDSYVWSTMDMFKSQQLDPSFFNLWTV